MIVDTHVHVIVPEITRDAAPGEAWRPQVYWRDGRQVIEVAGRQAATFDRDIVDIAHILDAQTAAGVDHVLVCPWVYLLRDDAEPDDGLRSSRAINEGLARLAQEHPDRVTTLGTIPLQAPDLAARELVALMAMPGMRGVMIAPSVRGAHLGDDRFRLFWEAAEATEALVFVHPATRGFEIARLGDFFKAFGDHFLWNTVWNPVETTIAAAHLVMTGVMERHPDLKVLLAHGGGAILALRGRLRHAHVIHPHARSRLTESVDDSLRRFYFDTLLYDTSLLRDLIGYAGADHVLLASDYPFDMALATPTEPVRALGLALSDEAKILGGNAARLLGLGVAR